MSNPSFLDEIWTIGFRNPWRFSIDRQTGDIYVGDVGNAVREEISFQSGTSGGGENYGWMVMEGTSCFTTCPSAPPCNDPDGSQTGTSASRPGRKLGSAVTEDVCRQGI